MSLSSLDIRLADIARPLFTLPLVRWIGLLGLCAAYLQGSLMKLFDFDSAIAEMNHFGLSPAPVFAVIVIVFELASSVMVLSGKLRWLGATGLGIFTLMATFVALRFWELPTGRDRAMATNAFFEHLGLVGGFVLVAWHDLQSKKVSRR